MIYLKTVKQLMEATKTSKISLTDEEIEVEGDNYIKVIINTNECYMKRKLVKLLGM